MTDQTEQYRLLRECYRSGQMSDKQLAEHLTDAEFAAWWSAQVAPAPVPEVLSSTGGHYYVDKDGLAVYKAPTSIISRTAPAAAGSVSWSANALTMSRTQPPTSPWLSMNMSGSHLPRNQADAPQTTHVCFFVPSLVRLSRRPETDASCDPQRHRKLRRHSSADAPRTNRRCHHQRLVS